MAEGVGYAPGKIILLGEHAVVYNHPAVAVPVRAVRAEAAVRIVPRQGIFLDCPDLAAWLKPSQPGPTETEPFIKLAHTTLRALGHDAEGLEISLRSTIPIRRGMGSGAALSVALVRAIAKVFRVGLSLDEVIALAYEAEKAFHGNPSGIDNNVVARDEPIYFSRRRGCEPIHCERGPFRFLIADCGFRSPTADIVRDLALARGRDRARVDSLLWEIGSLASFAREILAHGTPDQLGLCMNRNQELLAELGLSSPELDRLVEAARKAGAAGAKLSGAGRGGNVVVVLDIDAAEDNVRAALLESGARQVLSTSITNN